MTLTQLGYAVALAEHGHFGRAADACFVSQPTLSMQIRKLEDELDTLLFDRTQQPVRLTERGTQIVEQARIVLAERDRLLTMVRDEKTIAGELQLGIIPTLAPYLLPVVTPGLLQRYPELKLSIEEHTTELLIESIAAGRLDVAVIATEETRAGIESTPLFTEEFVAYVGRAHRLEDSTSLCPGDLDAADVWLLSEGHCLRDQVAQICRRADRTSVHGIHFESGSLDTLRHLVDRLGGMTLLPVLATVFLHGEAAGRIRRFEDPAPNRTAYIVRRRATARQHLIEAFADATREFVTPALRVTEAT
ncbi:MAG: LysR substrate-binding domain-containing protein [Bacteroidota bacterium]